MGETPTLPCNHRMRPSHTVTLPLPVTILEKNLIPRALRIGYPYLHAGT